MKDITEPAIFVQLIPLVLGTVGAFMFVYYLFFKAYPLLISVSHKLAVAHMLQLLGILFMFLFFMGPGPWGALFIVISYPYLVLGLIELKNTQEISSGWKFFFTIISILLFISSGQILLTLLDGSYGHF